MAKYKKYKKIYWHSDSDKNKKGEVFASVHFLVGYNQQRLEDYQKMADELRETFPQAKNSEIRCCCVIKSAQYEGCTLVAWNVYIPKKDYPGWTQYADEEPDYKWA